MEFSDILKVISQEMVQISDEVKLNLRYVSQLPELENYDGFSQAYLDGGKEKYWINWTEAIGAWASTDGCKVEIVVKESHKNSDLPGYLALGLSSLITGACLSLKNRVAIHANAIFLGDRTIAFAGFSGQGKSTLSAYLASRGAGFVTDDVLVINDAGLVIPGNPRIKLYAHTGKSLGFAGGRQTEYKTFYEPQAIGSKLLSKPAVPGIIYLLAEESPDIYSEKLSPGRAVFELLPHSYYAHQLITRNSQLFDAYLQLVSKFSIRKLYYPRRFELLPEVYEFLLREVREF